MTTKRKLRRRIADLEREAVLGRQYEFTTLEVDFGKREVWFDGRNIVLPADGPQVLSIPVLAAKPILQ